MMLRICIIAAAVSLFVVPDFSILLPSVCVIVHWHLLVPSTIAYPLTTFPVFLISIPV
jgi:hypothetical protein